MSRQPPNRFTISKFENNAITDKTKDVLTFLELADAVPKEFTVFGNVFIHRESAMRALALYFILRAIYEHKYDIHSNIIKKTYTELMNGNRYAMEADDSRYFVRPVAFDDPIILNGSITIGKFERFIPTLDAYIKMKHL
jgi:hypothetical protein